MDVDAAAKNKIGPSSSQNWSIHLVVVVLFFADDLLHFIAAFLLHGLHVCHDGQMLLTEKHKNKKRVDVSVPGGRTSSSSELP